MEKESSDHECRYLSKLFFKVVLVLFVMLFNGCSKTELGDTTLSTILALGNGNLLTLEDMVTTNNNDIIVGLSAWNNGSPDARVVCISGDGRVKWDKYLGSEQNDVLNKLFVDKKGNILVVGMTQGFKDTTLANKGNREHFYLHYLKPDGSTIWEKGIYASYNDNSLNGSKTFEIQEDAFGNYLITALYSNEFYVNGLPEISQYGTLVVVDKNGNLLDLYIQGVNPFYAPFLADQVYGVFFHSSEGAGVIEFLRNGTYHIPEDTVPAPSPIETNWSWKSKTNPVLGVWKSSPSSGIMQFVVIKQEGFVLFEYVQGGGLSAKELNLVSELGSSIPVAVASGNDVYLFADSKGDVFILNDKWELVNQIHTKWKIISLCSMPNGNIAVAFQNEAIIQIMLYNSNGKPIN